MTSWAMAKTVVSVLCDAGVQDLVISPGSRSAALAIALERAERAGAIRLHPRVDERSAGFLALGLAKSTGRLVPLVCTSGTAVGNLLPALMEASHARVPLLVISCDRPAYRVGTGASQTTDQVGVFTTFANTSLRLSSTSGREAYWAAGIRRAIESSLGTRTRLAGPSQVNLEFSNPMLPEPGDDSYRLDRSCKLKVSSTGPDELVALEPGPRTVVLAGDAHPQMGAAAVALAESAGLPLLAEPSSGARSGQNAISTYRILLDGGLRSRIERVITFGHPTLSRPVASLLSDPGVEQIVVTDSADWPDVGATASVVAGRVSLPAADPSWLGQWLDAETRTRAALAPMLEELNPYSLANAVVASVGEDENLAFGASNSIRDADLAELNRASHRTWSNRGLAGIDGTIATATGIALGTGRPTTLLLGDLTFLHDLGSLNLGGGVRPDLRIVVADDDGGSIFHTLEQGGAPYANSFERVFATPQGLDLVSLAEGFRLPARGITDLTTLNQALTGTISGVEVLVVQLDRSTRRNTDQAIRKLAKLV